MTRATERKGVLRPHHFISLRGGVKKPRTFYARTTEEAVRIALRWGTARGFKMYRRKKG